jgi:nucleoside 2-deoxyribosyltransferase
MRKPVIYLIGSLRNPAIASVAEAVEHVLGCECFASWAAASPTADDAWRDYERARGNTYEEALRGHAATHVFDFDREHIERADAGLLVLPAGRSGHLELGFMLGQGKPGWILRDDPERWDVMYRFATGVAPTREALFDMMRTHPLFTRVSE